MAVVSCSEIDRGKEEDLGANSLHFIDACK